MKDDLIYIRESIEQIGIEEWWDAYRLAHAKLLHGGFARGILDYLGFTYEMMLELERIVLR